MGADAEPKPEGSITDQELHDRIMSGPKVKARIKEALEWTKRKTDEPGVSADELPDFVREHS